MKRSYSVLSPCQTYTASIVDGQVEIAALDSGVLITYDIGRYIRQHLVGNDADVSSDAPNVSQLTWEKVRFSATATKLGIVVENRGLLMVFHVQATEPIVIHQPKDGIDRFEWIPPVNQQDDGDEGDEGYVNSKQLVIFTRNNLHMKLYSLDCTYILATIVKPLSGVVVRPHKRNWSIAAHTMEYNAPPVLYHFYNSGPVSTLVRAVRMPSVMACAPQLEWSVSGKWLGVFTNTMSDWSLQVMGLLGRSSEVKTLASASPVIDVDFADLGTNLRYPSLHHFANWINLDNSDYFVALTCDTYYEQLELVLVSLQLLRTVRRTVSLDDALGHCWKQTDAKSYRRVHMSVQPTELKKVHVTGPYVIVEFNNVLLVLEVLLDETLVVVSAISLGRLYRKTVVESNEVLMISSDHVAVYEPATNVVYVAVVKPKNTIRRAYSDVSDPSKYIIMDASLNREPVSGRNWHKQSAEPKQEVKEVPTHSELSRLITRNRSRAEVHLGSVNSSHLEDVTDTFNMKRRKVEKP